MSLAGIGLAGCRRPDAYVVPFNKGVEWTIPGKFLFMQRRCRCGRARCPLIVSTVDGRPTKIEGNPFILSAMAEQTLSPKRASWISTIRIVPGR